MILMKLSKSVLPSKFNMTRCKDKYKYFRSKKLIRKGGTELYKEIKVRVNLNTGQSTVIEEKIIFEDLSGTDAFCEHIIKRLEENNMLYPDQGVVVHQESNLVN